MQFKLAAAGLAAAAVVSAAKPSVNTPTTSLVQCVPFQLTWSDGTGPFTVIMHSFDEASQMQTGVLGILNNVQSSPITVLTTQPVGTHLQFDVTDSTGQTGQTGGTPAIIAGSTNCQDTFASGGSSSAPAGGATTSAAGTTPTTAAGTTAAGTTAPSNTSARPSTTQNSSTASTPSTRPNSASSLSALTGAIAGMVGVGAAALL